MKCRIAPRASEHGNLILVSLIVAAVTGIVLASYLILTEVQNVSIARSQNWNATMAVTEAGVEDGMQLINKFAGSFDDIWKWTNNVAADGWDSPAPNVYHIQRYLPVASTSGWSSNSYEVYITNYNNLPAIYSSGTVPWTLRYAAAASHTFYAQVGGATPTLSSLDRSVAVETHLDPLFVVSLAALGTIDLKGHNVKSDSFDSSDPNYSNNGLYTNDVTKTKANGDICTDATIEDSLNIGNAQIKGHVRTGQGVKIMTSLPNCSVGDSTWVQSGTKGVQLGYSTTDFNVYFPDVVLPDTTWLPVANNNQNQVIDGTLYTLAFRGNSSFSHPDDFVINNMPNGNVYIGTNTYVRLYVKGSVNMTGSGSVIRIVSSNAWLRIYMAGSTFSLSGGAYVDNESGHAERFYLYGLPGCTSITFGGNANFYGGVYAPEADFSLVGGGNDTWDFVGAGVAKSITLNGHFNFHYDENLAKIGPSKGYVPVAWKEF